MSKRIRLRKKGITIKIPRSQLEQDSVIDKVKDHLEKNPEDAYTIMGLMVEVFNYNPDDLNGPFMTWPKDAPSLYTKIRLALEKLKKDKLVDSKKRGRANFYYWKLKNER
ncbi:MAG: hypothetical protein ACTSUQ_01805 [Candidatus Freyarchaeota archaeon]